MCRGRHRVENREGEVQARGGAGRGRWGIPWYKCYSEPRKFCSVSVCPEVAKSGAQRFTAVLSKLHNARMAPAQDDFPAIQVCSVHGTRCVRVEVPSKASKAAKLRASLTKASRSLRILRLEASNIGGKLAREVKAAHMSNLQAAIY